MNFISDLGDEWQEATYDSVLFGEGAYYISAIVGDGENGNIAIDDITLLYGGCTTEDISGELKCLRTSNQRITGYL